VAYLPSRRAFIGALGGGHSPRNDATGSDFSMRPRQGQVDAVLREGLRTLGYVEGANLVIETRNAHCQVERLPTHGAETSMAPNRKSRPPDRPRVIGAR